jgi:hypothetical protein
MPDALSGKRALTEVLQHARRVQGSQMTAFYSGCDFLHRSRVTPGSEHDYRATEQHDTQRLPPVGEKSSRFHSLNVDNAKATDDALNDVIGFDIQSRGSAVMTPVSDSLKF